MNNNQVPYHCSECKRMTTHNQKITYSHLSGSNNTDSIQEYVCLSCGNRSSSISALTSTRVANLKIREKQTDIELYAYPYRYNGPYGIAHIDAKNEKEAMRIAASSLPFHDVSLSYLESWDGKEYIKVIR